MVLHVVYAFVVYGVQFLVVGSLPIYFLTEHQYSVFFLYLSIKLEDLAQVHDMRRILNNYESEAAALLGHRGHFWAADRKAANLFPHISDAENAMRPSERQGNSNCSAAARGTHV